MRAAGDAACGGLAAAAEAAGSAANNPASIATAAPTAASRNTPRRAPLAREEPNSDNHDRDRTFPSTESEQRFGLRTGGLAAAIKRHRV